MCLGGRLGLRSGLVFFLWVLLIVPFAAQAKTDEAYGESIYKEGILSSGKPLTAMRVFGALSGREAACINCHRPSGMGSVEGNIQIPPITGQALQFTGNDPIIAEMNTRARRSLNPASAPYTLESFTNALQHGINSQHREMLELMPRYNISSEDIKYLQSYLNTLSSTKVPGVSRDQIHFATVITPDVDPKKRAIFINTLEKFLVVKNASTQAGQGAGRRHMVTAGELVYGSERVWVNDLWELKGDLSTWNAQLERLYEKTPVFAMVSGFSASQWDPVAEFCEQKGIPSWFPIVDSAPESINQHYSLYFNRGVLLEADVLAQQLLDNPLQKGKRVVQLYSEGSVGIAAKDHLAADLKGSGMLAESYVFSVSGVKAVLSRLEKDDILMLWLKPEDLRLLNKMPPPQTSTYLSGLMAGGENSPVSAGWKKTVQMIYPYELPEKRQFSLSYFRQWMQMYQLEVADELFQSQIYFALDSFQQIMAGMWGNINRDYLIERAESQLGFNETANLESRNLQRASIRPIGRETVITQRMSQLNGSTTVYPHMSLGPGQRFSSKGAYVVRFKNADTNDLEALSSWLVPNRF